MPSIEDLDHINRLFDTAKETDEFEFVSTLLRIQGMSDAGWDSLYESQDLIHQTLKLIQSPIADIFRARLFLMLYCHVTEMDDLYAIVGNMLRVLQGERYSMAPFIGDLHSSGKPARYPAAKAERIAEWATAVGNNEIGDIFKYIVVRQVRNAFSHSSYTLYRNEFRIIKGQGVNIDGIITPKIELAWLLPRIELAINTVLRVIDLVRHHRQSYTEEKVIQGRFGSDGSVIDVQLTVQEGHGLMGFRSPPENIREEE